MNKTLSDNLFGLPVLLTFCLLISGCQFCLSPDNIGEKLVLTHVMHQMAIGAEHREDETCLSYEPSRANGIMAQHVPEYLMNFERPKAAARQDIAMMRNAGVNAIALLLCKGHLKSQFASMIHAYYQCAMEAEDMKIAPESWSGQFDAPEEMAGMYGELYDKYGPAWLKRDGRLVVLFWMNYGTRRLPPYKETVDKAFARIGGRENVYLVLYSPCELEKHNPDWFEGADAFTGWLTDSYGRASLLLKNMQDCVAETGKELWIPVMPSFQQSRYPHESGKFIPNLREKLGATWFRKSWKVAIDSDAPVVCLQTWNDLTEDSAIMPESNHGYSYYKLNKYFAEWFRGGKEPVVKNEQVIMFHHPQVVEGLRLPEGTKPMEGFPIQFNKTFDSAKYNRTPPTDYVQVVAMLKAPAEITVRLGERVLATRSFPAGVNFWLIYQPRNLNDPMGRYTCDADKVYPKSEENFFVTKVKSPHFPIGFPKYKEGYYPGFPDAEVFVEVKRGENRLGFFRSHKPVLGAAGRGEMTVIGDVFDFEQ